MKRSTSALAVAFIAALGLAGTAAPVPSAAQQTTIAQAGAAPGTPAADFGSPPSGEVPILFNDRHVYAKPDRLKAGRVLAAIVRGQTILVPMRSLFEAMGATTSYDPSTKTVAVSKAGANVSVTVGKAEVIINGESRPLDVPPEIYKGTVVVPLRVISEGMGAYVQWLAEKRTVVVRYLAAPVPTAPPAVPPPPAATPVPVPSPTATPKRPSYERFVVGDYIIAPKIYNELSPGNTGKNSFHVAGAAEFPLLGLPWMLEADFRSFEYDHDADANAACTPSATASVSCATAIGNQGSVFVPRFRARDEDLDGRFGLKVADPRIYLAVAYLFRNTNFEGGAFPTQQHGVGFGAEKLPDLDQPFSLYGSVYYYPIISTNASQNLGGGNFGQVQYRDLTYAVGATVRLVNPLYLDLGYLGDRGYNKQNAPSDFTHAGPYAGLGLHF